METAIYPGEMVWAMDITKIFASKTNPRKNFDPEKLKDLTASIKEKGLLEPLLVRTGENNDGETVYELVAGERRWRAAKAAGLETVMVIKRELTNAQVLEIQVVENMQREDLTPMEEAAGYKMLHEKYNMDWDELAVKIGKSKSYIYKRLKLLDLQPEVRQAVLDGTLPVSWAQEFLRVPAKSDQLTLLDECTGYREIDNIQELRERGFLP